MASMADRMVFPTSLGCGGVMEWEEGVVVACLVWFTNGAYESLGYLAVFDWE